MPKVRRTFLLCALVVLLVGAWAPSLGVWAPWLRFDATAKAKVLDGTERAVVAYAAARGLSAVISAVKATTIDIEPGGVGVTLAPAQALEPLNHLLEKFSDLMLVEPPRVLRRLQLLRRWSHEQVEQVFT